jgi:DNA topoisomerase I
VIAEKAAKGANGRGRSTPAALKELGDHPDGGKITVRDGRYGPYVNWGKVNATLPKGSDPMAITLDEALALVAAKAGKSGSGKSAAGSKSRTKAKAKPAAKGKSSKAGAKAPAQKS